MRRYTLFFAFFLFGIASALPNSCNISYSSSAVVEFTGAVTSFDLTVRTFPQDCQNAPYAINSTEYGKVLEIRETVPDNPYSWGFTCTFVKETEINNIEELFGYPYSFGIGYTDFTEYADYSEEVSRMASEITMGSRSVLEAGLKIARWVHSNIEYDMFYGEAIKEASWVFENRRGVCDEYSNLFVSMARSVGIPARFVSGMAYTNLLEDFGAHAWAEFYAGQWIAVDLTFGQFGTIDASHIATYYSLDAGFNAESITVRGGGSAVLYEPENTAIAECTQMEEFEFNAYLDRSEISDNDYALITLEVENPYDYYIPLTVKFLRVDKLELLHGSYEDYIILSPSSENIKNYLVHVDDLPNNYVYTLPLSIEVDLAGRKNMTLTVDPRNQRQTYEYYLSRISEGLAFNSELEISDFSATNPNYEDNATVRFSASNKGNEILDMNATVYYGEWNHSYSLGELLLNQERDFEIQVPCKGKGEFEAKIERFYSNKSSERSFQLIFAEAPVMFIEHTIPANFTSDFQFNVSTPECASGILEITTPSKNYEIAPGNNSLGVSSNVFRPGQNTVTLNLTCIDEYGKAFNHVEEFETSFNVSGIGSFLAWIKFFWNKVVVFTQTLINYFDFG